MNDNNRKRIFIVQIFALESILRDHDHYLIRCFECAGDVLQYIQDKCELPDLLILPFFIRTGSINGVALTEMIKSDLPDDISIPVIMVAEKTTKRRITKKQSHADFIICPFNLDNVLAREEFLKKVDELAYHNNVVSLN